MARDKTVILSSNNNYWQAFYYDNMGKRRAKSLGSKKKLSKRQAKVLCDRFAAEIQINPGRAGTGKTFRLGDYLSRYLASRTALRPRTLELHELNCKIPPGILQPRDADRQNYPGGSE